MDVIDVMTNGQIDFYAPDVARNVVLSIEILIIIGNFAVLIFARYCC